MKVLLLDAPLKTTEEINWAKPLNNYLLSIYGNTEEFQEDLTNLTSSRQKVQSVSLAADDSSVIDAFFEYYSQLELVDLRIPMSIIKKRKFLKFTWTDAFSPTEETAQYTLAYEKASVLFNLGSVMMKAAAFKYNASCRVSESGEEAFKEAIKLMQQAAGVYQYISENFINGPCADLKPSTITFLSNLCLAQSQEMFTLKVIDGDLEQKKNSLISKLCASAAKYNEELYVETAHLVDESWSSVAVSSFETDKDVDDESSASEKEEGGSELHINATDRNKHKLSVHLPPSWVATFRAKQQYYTALAYYFHGLQLETGSKFGEAIAYLTKSSQQLGEITPQVLKSLTKTRGHNIYEMLDNIEYQKDASRIKLADLNKDNDLIYHDIVPSLVTLVKPKPLNSAKLISMNKIEECAIISEKNYKNFLSHVVPVGIHELLSCYSEEKSQFLRNELDAVDVSNEELSSALEYLNLPKALVSIKELRHSENPLDDSAQEFQLDPESIRKVNEISNKHAQDVSNRDKIEQLRKQIFGCASKSEGLLNSASSGTSQELLRDDLIKLKRSLYDATNQDSRLLALINEENSAFYQTLGKGVNSTEFKNLFQMPDFEHKVDNAQDQEISLLDMDDAQINKSFVTIEAKISRLEDLLNEVNILRTKKAKVISDLKKAIHDDDISDILLINTRVKSNTEIKSIIFPEELKKFNGYSTNLDTLISKQKTYMGEVTSLWEEISTDPKIKEIQSSSAFRNGLLNEQKAKIDAFYENNWKKYSAGLQKGTEFYTSLLEYAMGLQQTIERETQTGLSSSMASLNLDTNYTGASSGAYDPRTHSNSENFVNSSSGWDANAYLNQNKNIFQSSNNASAYSTSQISSTPIAPQLPPKRPSQSSMAQPASFQAPVSSYSTGTGAQAPRVGQDINSNSHQGKDTGLIYDQPSAYQPNMYDLLAQTSFK